jgi:hypothetical protein
MFRLPFSFVEPGPGGDQQRDAIGDDEGLWSLSVSWVPAVRLVDLGWLMLVVWISLGCVMGVMGLVCC